MKMYNMEKLNAKYFKSKFQKKKNIHILHSLVKLLENNRFCIIGIIYKPTSIKSALLIKKIIKYYVDIEIWLLKDEIERPCPNCIIACILNILICLKAFIGMENKHILHTLDKLILLREYLSTFPHIHI